MAGRFWPILVGLMLAGGAAAAPNRLDTALASLPEIARGTVASVEDGATLTLTDGRVLRLADVLAPAAPLGRSPETPWPAAVAAQHALSDMVLGRVVVLRGLAGTEDRHGRFAGELLTSNGEWLQRVLVLAGQGRVDPVGTPDAFARALLQAEARARRARRGLWQGDAYRVRQPEGLRAQDTGGFVLVEGEILAVSPTAEATYLDFAEDWRHGFSVRITRRVLRQQADWDPARLGGRRVRVRGWLRFEGRPILDLDDLQALEPLAKKRDRGSRN